VAMEIHVFFSGKAPTKAALARALKELDFPLTIPDAKGSLAQQSGYLPMRLRREETGVELDVYDDHAAIAEFAPQGIRQDYERFASFRWGGDTQEAAAGLCGAAALAKLTNGTVLDVDGNVLVASQAITAARQFLDQLPKPNPRLPGTRPADIKRYLKPLLALRDDLVLRGRHLIIRPVRHILRGVIFDRTSDKYTFHIWRYIAPLYSASPGPIGLGDDLHSIRLPVWNPQFKPILLDSLAEDIFDCVGQITSFAELAQYLEGTDQFHRARVQAFVLSGQHQLATSYIADLEQQHLSNANWQRHVRDLRILLDRDISAVLNELHAAETKAVHDLKLGDIWQPSPFPVELPVAQRIERSSEPTFATTPWVSRPTMLFEEVPDRPGDVRFAGMSHSRKGRIVLLLPLTRGEAEKRHLNREDYVLAARLAGDRDVLLKHVTHWSPHNPEPLGNRAHVPFVSLYLTLRAPRYGVRAWFSEHPESRGVIELHSIEVLRQNGPHDRWYCWYDLKEGTKDVRDRRIALDHYAQLPLTDRERQLLDGPIPGFGDFERPLRSVIDLLHLGGIGDVS